MDEELAFSLPSPADTSYRTPSSTRSRRSRPYDDMSSPSYTPPSIPADERSLKRESDDFSNPALDESISPLDPRRFTPTLHASLVSEILSLRRDLDDRRKDIEQLELSFHTTHAQNEKLNNDLLASNKETRSVKRQMQMLEGGSMSALNELAKERDDALEDVLDLRRRLEQSQKRVKTHEDNAGRTQALWENDKEAWLAEKRGLETKVHVVEGRLKAVLTEVANSQLLAGSTTHVDPSHNRNSMESPSRGSIRGFRSRRQSAASDISDQSGGRHSVLSFTNGTGTNLADELAFDEAEEDHLNSDHEDGRVSPDALPEERERPMSRMSNLSVKARKILGLQFDMEDNERSRSATGIRSEYVDTGIQFSPPTTPGLQTAFSDHASHTSPKPSRTKPVEGLACSASSADTSSSKDVQSNTQPQSARSVMVSSSCQTVEALPSPPLTPKKPDMLPPIPGSALERSEMRTGATQTDALPVIDNSNVRHKRKHTPELQIPLIAIIPPESRPATPETNVVLPPRTKNAGCQVNIPPPYTTTAMQTREIRVDQRFVAPPPVPAPTSIHSRPMAPVAARPPTSSLSLSRRRPQRAPASAPLLWRSAPRPNDDGPLARDFAFPRPVRSSSLFAGFEDDIDEKNQKFLEDAFSEDDIFSRPTAKFVLRSGKMVLQEQGLENIGENVAASAGQTVALEHLRQSEDSLPPELRSILPPGKHSPRKKSFSRVGSGSKQLKRAPSSKSSNMRRAALISSGAVAHQASNSQSTTTSIDKTNPPPFPVPVRYSSTKTSKSISEGGRSSRASSSASPTKQIKHKTIKPPLRKARSAAAISHSPNRRQGSQSPHLDPRISIVPEMPSFQMPQPRPNFLQAEAWETPQEASAPRPSIATGPNRKGSHVKTNSDAAAMGQTSVVDSIAQTMVGEWMYKYVRRRKSFGIPDKSTEWDPSKSVDELSASVTNTGVRHKRWVWLAPYERAVMWSNKQPTSGTSLMGKSGRKCKPTWSPRSHVADIP